MDKYYEKLQNCYKVLREKTDFVPDMGLILGSGLGDFANRIDVEVSVDYNELPGFPVSTVPGHAGRFVFGYVGDVKVVVMQGRVHYYEGYDVKDVVMPTRLMAMMGAKVLFVTNAAGGINKDFEAGDMMLIKDHIMSFFPNPLVGENIDELGTRFPDMSHGYNEELREIVKNTAKDLGIKIQEGVYVQLSGPSFETPAEIKMLGIMGADAVGMSTACEVVAANHAGMKAVGISCISNLAAGISPNPLTHAEVQETADRVAPLFRELVKESIKNIGKTLK